MEKETQFSLTAHPIDEGDDIIQLYETISVNSDIKISYGTKEKLTSLTTSLVYSLLNFIDFDITGCQPLSHFFNFLCMRICGHFSVSISIQTPLVL